MIKVEMHTGDKWNQLDQDAFVRFLDDNKPIMVIVRGDESTIVNKHDDMHFRTKGYDPVHWLRKSTSVPIFDSRALH